MKYHSKNLEEMKKIGNDITHHILLKGTSDGHKGAVVVGLYGDLGAGKTTLSKFIAESLGVEDNVTSPTFVIEKIYPIRTNGRLRPTSNGAGEFKHLIHIDAYRLEKPEELLNLGWKEVISSPKNIVLIEWPERVAEIMPPHIKINLTHVSENERHVEVV